MSEINVVNTYTIDINRDIKAFATNFILDDGNDHWFKLHYQKIQVNSHDVEIQDNGLVKMIIKATAYLNIIPEFDKDSSEIVNGKTLFTIVLDNVKISNLKGDFQVEPSYDDAVNLDLNFNSKLTQKDKDFFTKEIISSIGKANFKVNIEQTVSETKFVKN